MISGWFPVLTFFIDSIKSSSQSTTPSVSMTWSASTEALLPQDRRIQLTRSASAGPDARPYESRKSSATDWRAAEGLRTASNNAPKRVNLQERIRRAQIPSLNKTLSSLMVDSLAIAFGSASPSPPLGFRRRDLATPPSFGILGARVARGFFAIDSFPSSSVAGAFAFDALGLRVTAFLGTA